jgi:hypothetical protein
MPTFDIEDIRVDATQLRMIVQVVFMKIPSIRAPFLVDNEWGYGVA